MGKASRFLAGCGQSLESRLSSAAPGPPGVEASRAHHLLSTDMFSLQVRMCSSWKTWGFYHCPQPQVQPKATKATKAVMVLSPDTLPGQGIRTRS